MADKVVVVSQQALKPIKLVKWKVNEGNSVSIGCVVLLYEVDEDDKHVVCKLKSTKAGTVHKLLAQEGDVVKPGENLLELQACLHPTVMRDMCAECGADLRKDDTTTSASVPMVHSVPDLKVSVEQAQKIGKADVDRLLKDRKLVLLVDLDQTLIHTTNDNIPANIKDVYHFQLYGAHSPWYHTRLRPGTHRFLENMSPYFELHICTFGARNYAHMIAMFLDQEGKLFSQRILSRDECFNPTSKTANLTALFPCGDEMVCIIDDREDVWSYAANLIHVKPYHFFQHTGDINAPPGLDKHESDDKEGVDLSKVNCDKQKKVNGVIENNVENDKSSNSNNTDNQENKIDDEKEDKENTTNVENTNQNKNDNQVHLEKVEKTTLVNKNNLELSNDVDKKENNIETKNETSENNDIKENNETPESNKNEVKEQNNIKEDITKNSNEEKENVPAQEQSQNEEPTKEENNGEPTKEENNEEPTKEDNNGELTKEENNGEPTKEENNGEPTKEENNGGPTKEENNEEPTKEENNEEPTKEENNEESTNGSKNTEDNSEEINKKKQDLKSLFKQFNNIEQESKEDDLIEIEDPDDYLLYLENILKVIHKSFYDKYDKMEAGRVPDLKKVIPEVRRKVLKDTRLVFSGLVPTHIKLEQSKAYQVAKSLGATVTQDLEDKTTHLVAVRPGTAKVNAGRRKKNLKIVTPDWLWACAERWDKVEEKLYTLNNKGSKNRHPPPHCSSPEHNSNFVDVPETSTRKRTPSGRFMDTINPLMSFSSADIADMDREVEDIFNESESDGESSKKQEKEVDDVFVQDFKKAKESDDSSSSSGESLTGEHPHGWRPTQNSNKRRRSRDDDVEDESTADEFPSTKFRRGEALSSDLDIGQDSNSEGSAEAPDEIDDGDWNMMGAALEREFLSNN